jgi:hypothetical protein
VAHEERRKYKWLLVGGYGVAPDSSSAARKRASSSSGATQAQIGIQAGSDSGEFATAGPATSLPVIPAGIPSAANKKRKGGYLEHLAWDGTLWRAAVTEDGTSFIIIRNGQTSIANGLHILDWHGEPWVVTIENKTTFVYTPPDPTAMPPKPTFRVGAMQYLDWFSTPCEVKIVDTVIAPVMKLSNGGHGGQGGPGGAAGAGANGGNGGNISVATTNPALLLNVHVECLGGSGGLSGAPGPGGKGGAGGKGQVVGMTGPDGPLGPEAPPGTPGKRGTIQYIRLDNAGNVIQRGTKKPELKLVSLETKCVSGSAVLETSEKACISAKFVNIGDISAPPNVLVQISNVDNLSAPHGFVIDEWLEPGVEFTIKLYVELGPLPGAATFDLAATVHSGLLYSGKHELKDIQHPVAICTILNTPHVVSGQELELGAIIQNSSGIATGTIHNRHVRAEIHLEPGLVFLDGPTRTSTLSSDNTSCSTLIEDIREAPERVLRRVSFARDLPPFSSRSWTFRLFWKDTKVGEVVGKVKMIPAYDAEAAADADALIVTHPGFTSTSFTRLLNLFAEFKMRAVTYDYYYYKGVKPNNPFRAKLILFCLRDGADIELFTTEQIKSHFFGDDGTDQDSSLLILSPDASETVALLNRRLVEVGHDSTEEEMTRKFFSKPTSKDFHEVVHSIEKEYFPKFPDYYVWSTSKEQAVKVGSGMRAKWKLGEVKVLRSTLSYFHRLYVMPCNYVTQDTVSKQEMENLNVALRHSLTLSHKVFLIETDTKATVPLTEAALYYDLKSEFFFLPRPLTFMKQMTDLLFQFTYRYATERIVEAVLRCLYRLRAATYWKSFGFSDFKSKFTTLEAILKRLKETLSSFAFELQTNSVGAANRQQSQRRLDFAAIDSRAQSGAKSSSRVKWRKQPLPMRLRDIPAKEDLKVAPPAEISFGFNVDPSQAFQDAAEASLSSSSSTSSPSSAPGSPNLSVAAAATATTQSLLGASSSSSSDQTEDEEAEPLPLVPPPVIPSSTYSPTSYPASNELAAPPTTDPFAVHLPGAPTYSAPLPSLPAPQPQAEAELSINVDLSGFTEMPASPPIPSRPVTTIDQHPSEEFPQALPPTLETSAQVGFLAPQTDPMGLPPPLPTPPTDD